MVFVTSFILLRKKCKRMFMRYLMMCKYFPTYNMPHLLCLTMFLQLFEKYYGIEESKSCRKKDYGNEYNNINN